MSAQRQRRGLGVSPWRGPGFARSRATNYVAQLRRADAATNRRGGAVPALRARIPDAVASVRADAPSRARAARRGGRAPCAALRAAKAAASELRQRAHYAAALNGEHRAPLRPGRGWRAPVHGLASLDNCNGDNRNGNGTAVRPVPCVTGDPRDGGRSKRRVYRGVVGAGRRGGAAAAAPARGRRGSGRGTARRRRAGAVSWPTLLHGTCNIGCVHGERCHWRTLARQKIPGITYDNCSNKTIAHCAIECYIIGAGCARHRPASGGDDGAED